jgi:gamma-glutamyltranspeptidase/glutathione hydrolase
VRVENGISPDTVSLLRAKGHDVYIGAPLGRCESIVWQNDLFFGAVDPRARSGGAAGF